MDTRIYEITHKEFSKPNLPEYIRLQVGAALHESLGYEADNTGDNISEKNPSYCELTGLYWLWKNIRCDIIGICHYRRYFFSKGDFLRKNEIESILRDYDVIIPDSYYFQGQTIYEEYAKMHHIKDMDAVRDVISELYPEYLDSFDLSMNCDQLTPLNMLVTRKDIFDKYCSWLFSILFEVEKRIDISSYDNYQARVFGFLSERLTNVFFIHNTYKVKAHPVSLTDPAEIENSLQASNLKKTQISYILSDLDRDFLSDTFHDLIDRRPKDIDFHGKTPVWFCWWQGIDNTPDIVKLCLNSIWKNIPSDRAELHFITMENFIQYVDFPDWIIKKFLDGKISLSHLSYLLKFNLLYRYGGLWLDADDYMAKPFNDDFWASTEFYSLRSEKEPDRTDITNGRWSLNLIKGEAGDIIFKYLLNALYEYWNKNDELIDEALPDYIMSIAYDAIPEIKRKIDDCPISQPHTKDLVPLLDRVFDEKKWHSITSDTNIFKLSYSKNCRFTNQIGKRTFYSVLINYLKES